MTKRARERARQEKQVSKQEKRDARSEEAASIPAVDEGALMEEFARLSEQYSSDKISESDYNTERHRIFVELGLEREE
ncbi:MAG: hypothetical protein ACRDZM_12185 [Acidimicrobiia bacterium]